MERCELARGLLVFVVSFIILFDFLNYVHALRWFRKKLNATEFKVERIDECPLEAAIETSARPAGFLLHLLTQPRPLGWLIWEEVLPGWESTSRIISKKVCIYFLPVRESVLSRPSLSRGIQVKDAVVVEMCRQSSNLSTQCVMVGKISSGAWHWVQIPVPPLISSAALGKCGQDNKLGNGSSNRPRLWYGE